MEIKPQNKNPTLSVPFKILMEKGMPKKKIIPMAVWMATHRNVNLKMSKAKVPAIRKKIIEFNPDILLSVDSPDFTLRVAEKVKKNNPKIKTIHYVAPQVWVWREGRVKKFKKFLDHILLLFNFEKKYFDKENIKNTFVGHPLLENKENIKTDLSNLIKNDKKIISSLQNSLSLNDLALFEKENGDLLIKKNNNEISSIYEKLVREALNIPKTTKTLDFLIVRSPKATQTTSIDIKNKHNLYFAGDWTINDLPNTMETAVLSSKKIVSKFF